jgi:recombination protein RecR
MFYPQPMNRLIHELAKLPGVGPKTAQRLAFHVLNLPETEVAKLAEALVEAAVLCVVEEPKDVITMEKTRVFKGQYHVLGGAISPLEGIGPDDLRIKELLRRVGAGGFMEVIIATDPNVEGEATALYLGKILKPLSVKITRLARGLPIGGDLEYVDEITLGKALEGRVEF